MNHFKPGLTLPQLMFRVTASFAVLTFVVWGVLFKVFGVGAIVLHILFNHH